MGKIVLIGLGMILALIGVIMIFDARILTKKLFSFGDQNEGAMGMKMTGFVIGVVGGLILLFQL